MVCGFEQFKHSQNSAPQIIIMVVEVVEESQKGIFKCWSCKKLYIAHIEGTRTLKEDSLLICKCECNGGCMVLLRRDTEQEFLEKKNNISLQQYDEEIIRFAKAEMLSQI